MSKVSPFFRWLAILLVGIVPWVFFWAAFYRPLAWAFPITLSVFAVAIVVSIFLLFKPRLRFISALVFAGPLTLFLLYKMVWVLSFFMMETSTYYLGMDVSTPGGLKMCKSMIQYSNAPLPPWMRQFGSRRSTVVGEANFCDLGNRKNLVAVLAFEDDLSGKRTLSMLPWLAAKHPIKYREKLPPFIPERLQLTEKFTPILVTFRDVSNPMSMERVFPGKLADVLGEGYSIQSIWVEMTMDEYESGGAQQRLTWIGSRAADKTWAYVHPFKKLGLGGIGRPFKRDM